MLRVTDTERPRRSLVHGERILSGNRVLLPGLGDVVVVLVSQVAAPDLEVVPGVHLAVVDVLGQTVGHGGGPHEQPIVFAGGLGEAHDLELLRYGLPAKRGSTVSIRSLGFKFRKFNF